MQAIVTRYAGPTNYRPSRIIARCDAGRITVEWNYELDVEANHVAAARALVRKLGWDTDAHLTIIGSGSLPAAGADGYAHIVGRAR